MAALGADEPTFRRSGAVDIARGLAVAGVVATHLAGSLIQQGLITSHHPFNEWIVNLGLLRLPSLAFLFGLFIPLGVARRGAGGYLRRRLVSIGYIFVLWSGIYAASTLVTSVLTNHPSRDWLTWLTIWQPDGLWFLAYVMVSTVVIVALGPWRGRLWAIVALTVSLAVTLLMWGRQIEWVGPVGLALIFFSTMGATFGLPRVSGWLARPAWIWAIAAILASVVFGVLLLASPHHPTQGRSGVPLQLGVLSLITSIVGIVATVAVSRLLDGIPRLNVMLRRVGRSTLAIYAMNLLVLWTGNHVLSILGVRDVATRIIVQVLLGVAVPVAVVWLAPRLGLGWLFVPPRRLLGTPPETATRQPGRSEPAP